MADLPTMETKIAEELSLLDSYRQLERAAQLVILGITRRMLEGQKEYGILVIQDKTRDWIEEALEESLDQSVYLQIEAMRRRLDAAG